MSAAEEETTPKAPKRDAMGNIKQPTKRSKESMGEEKIGSALKSLDNMRVIIDLLDNVKDFIGATATATDTDDDSKSKVVNEAFDLSKKTLKEHIDTVSKLLNNTKEMNNANRVHLKLTKKDKYLAQNAKLENQRKMRENPVEALTSAINTAKDCINKIGKHEETMATAKVVNKERPSEKSSETPSETPSKPSKPSKKKKTDGQQQQQEEEPEEVVEIHLPTPTNGFIYQTYEAVETLKDLEANIESLSGTKNKNMQRRFKRKYKDEMISKGYVPVKKSALNDFAATYAARENAPAPPPFWNMKGRREYISLDVLRAKAIAHNERTGEQWTRDHTVAAIYEVKKAKAIEDGKDPAKVAGPEKKTVDAYHAALKNSVDQRVENISV